MDGPARGESADVVELGNWLANRYSRIHCAALRAK